MATHYARNAYLQAQVQPKTNPKRLILMLYAGALKEAIEQQNALQHGEHLSRTVAIVSTLRTSPDSSEGEVMHGLYEALLSTCDNYQVMQQAHLHCLATEAQPEIERLVFERERLFADLQNHLTTVVSRCRKPCQSHLSCPSSRPVWQLS